MKFRFIYSTLLFLGAFVFSFAQEKTIRGIIKDEAGQSVPGATILVKETGRGVAADFDGKYSVKANVGETLVFSAIGMKSQERKITANASTIDVTLPTEIQQLEETVVIGYGSGKKITSVSGSVSQVKMSDYANAPSANAFDALQGKVAGLQIVATSGEPGDGSNIVLHGQGNIKGFFGEYVGAVTSPLFVLDGIPVDKNIALSMNSSDFESVTVLKDASATSIYGARASNGVIYITTKKGKRNEKGIVTINTQLGFSNLYSRKFYDTFMNSQEYMNYWVERGNITRDIADNILSQYPNETRWDEFYFKKNALTSQTSVSFSGGNEKMNYYISGGHFKQEGIMYRSGYQRYTLSGNFDANVNDWLKIGLNLSTGDSENSVAYGTGAGDSPLLSLPFYSFFDNDGNKVDYIENILNFNQRIYNPEYLSNKNPASSQMQEIIPIGYVSIQPFENLIFKSQGGVQYSVSEYGAKTLPSSHLTARTDRSLGKSISKTLTNTLEYKFQFGQKHLFTALLGQESISQDSNGFSASSQGQTDDNLTMLIHGTNNKEVSDTKSVSTFNSFFSRLDYNYNNRYFVDISARRDGSSNFGRNNRYANFWALGLLWRAKNEAFLENVSWLDLLNIKFSTGISGNANIGQYSHLTLINNSLRYNGLAGYSIDRLGNPNLQWEKQQKTNIGISVGLFKNIALEVDFYNRITHDMLFDQSLPSYTGFASYSKNSAKLQNNGVDVTLSFTAYSDSNRNISVRPYLNFNYNAQKVLSVYEAASKNPIQSSFGVMIKEGEPITYAFPIFNRVNPETGDPEWFNPSDDNTITNTDENNVSTVFNVAKLIQNTGKKVQAPLNGGFGLTASYGAFSMQVGFSFSHGKYMKNLDKLFAELPTNFGRRNLSRNVANYWKNAGDVAEFPSVKHRAIQRDTRVLEDASFIRLKDLSFSYNLPKKIIKEVGFFEGVRFYATGRNLLTFTEFSGADPEFEVLATQGGYPSSKQYTFGVEVKF